MICHQFFVPRAFISGKPMAFLHWFVISLTLTVLVVGCSPKTSQDDQGENNNSQQNTAGEAQDTTKQEEHRTELSDSGVISARFLDYMSGDEDRKAEYGLMMVDAFLKNKRFAEAELAASRIEGFRKAVAYFHLAEEAQRAGDRPASDRYFAMAASLPAGQLDHEKDSIYYARARALAARGDQEAAAEAMKNVLNQTIRRDLEAELFEFEDKEAVAKRLEEYLQSPGLSPTMQAKAMLFAAQTLRKAGEAEQADKLLQQAVETLSMRYEPDTVPLLCKAAGMFYEAGNQQEAERWAEVGYGFALRVPSIAYWRIRDMRLVAQAFEQQGNKDRAAEIYAEIVEMPAGLDMTGYSKGAVEAGLAYFQNGKEDMFHEAAAHVVRQMRHHVHPRARAMAVVDVLAAYASLGIEPPEAVNKEIELTEESIKSGS